MKNNRPKPHRGLHHLALTVTHFDASLFFYKELLGMHIVWHPDEDNVYLSSGPDNLALHRARKGFEASGNQRLDHLGFFVDSREAVDEWFAFLENNDVPIKATPKDHRDGTRSFYCADPDGNIVQVIYYPLS